MTAHPPVPLLQVRQLRVAYTARGAVVDAVRGVDLDIHPGEVVAVVGESGSGKSSLAMAVLHLLHGGHIRGGNIRFDGADITSAGERIMAAIRGSSIGLVPQDPGVSLNPVKRIGDQVAEVLRLHGRVGRATAWLQAVDILRGVGLRRAEVQARQYPHELSGGERQRVLIGIAMACEPRLLIADEATSALDVTVQQRILDLMAAMAARSGSAILLITHDLAVAADRADRVVVMRDGQVVEAGPAAQVLARPTHPYTAALLAAAPRVPAQPAAAHNDAAPAPLLSVRDLGKTFHARGVSDHHAVRQVSFDVPRGQTFAIVGESGSGKSTTARMVARLETPTEGRLLFDGQDVTRFAGDALRGLRRRLQLVYQDPYGSLNPRMSVEDIIAEPLRAFGVQRRAGRAKAVAQLLDQVALPRSVLQRRPAALSGGQRQRVAIARALALKPDMVVLDEPVSALDVSVQAQVLELLLDLQRHHGLTYLFISHDLGVVRQISQQVGVMQAGMMVEAGPTEAIFRSPQHAYTHGLLAAIPGRRRAETDLLMRAGA